MWAAHNENQTEFRPKIVQKVQFIFVLRAYCDSPEGFVLQVGEYLGERLRLQVVEHQGDSAARVLG